MGNDSAAVHDDPFPVFLAFRAGLDKAGVAHRIAHAGGQRLGLPVGGAAGNDHALEQRGEVLGVEHRNGLGLHVLKGIDDDSLEFLDVFFGGGVGSGHQSGR